MAESTRPLPDADDESEWEYEYDENETEEFYFTLDLTSNTVPHPMDKPRGRYMANPFSGASSIFHADGRVTVLDEDDSSYQANGAASSSNKIQFLDLHTSNPLVMHNERLYTCTWAQPIGTTLAFARKRPNPEPAATLAPAHTSSPSTNHQPISTTATKSAPPLYTLPTFKLHTTTPLHLLAESAELRPRPPKRKAPNRTAPSATTNGASITADAATPIEDDPITTNKASAATNASPTPPNETTTPAIDPPTLINDANTPTNVPPITAAETSITTDATTTFPPPHPNSFPTPLTATPAQRAQASFLARLQALKTAKGHTDTVGLHHARMQTQIHPKNPGWYFDDDDDDGAGYDGEDLSIDMRDRGIEDVVAGAEAVGRGTRRRGVRGATGHGKGDGDVGRDGVGEKDTGDWDRESEGGGNWIPARGEVSRRRRARGVMEDLVGRGSTPLTRDGAESVPAPGPGLAREGEAEMARVEAARTDGEGDVDMSDAI